MLRRKFLKRKPRKKPKKKRKKESPFFRGRGVVSRFFGKNIDVYFSRLYLLPKTRSAWPLYHLAAGFGSPLPLASFFIFWPLYGWQIVKECCLNSKDYFFNRCLKRCGKLLGNEWWAKEKAGVCSRWKLLWMYTSANSDETVGIGLHKPIVKELEKVEFSDWKKWQKRVRPFAQKGCLTKDSRS